MDYTAALSLAYRLVQTAGSKSFSKRLKSLWNGKSSDVICAIRRKAENDLWFQLRNTMSDNIQMLTEFVRVLDYHCENLGVLVKTKDRKGLVSSLTTHEHTLLRDLLYQMAKNRFIPLEIAQDDFLCRNALSALCDYFYIKDGVESGLNHKGLQNVFNKLLATKPPSFFRKGIVSDLLVCDRNNLESGREIKYLVCMKEYLSTISYTEYPHFADSDPNLEVLKIA